MSEQSSRNVRPGTSAPEKTAANPWCMLLMSLGMAACDSTTQERPITYRGKYHVAVEGGFLTQDGVDACIQIEWGIPAEEIPEPSDDAIAVRGVLSKPGKYGSAGCSYKLTGTTYLGHVQTDQ